MVKIYTKTGDSGETSLLGGQRVSKSCLDIQVVGELDELNAILGIVVVNLLDKHVLCHPERNERAKRVNGVEGSLEVLVDFLQKIQRDLLKIGSEVASLQTKLLDKIEKVDSTRVMEKMIDAWSEKLPKLNNFILPGGSLTNAYLHLARAVCRRAERALVVLGKQKKVRPELYKYLNRSSDFLFVAARWVNR